MYHFTNYFLLLSKYHTIWSDGFDRVKKSMSFRLLVDPFNSFVFQHLEKQLDEGG